MRKLLLVLVVAMASAMPLAAQAQQQSQTTDVMGLNSDQVLAIGLGVVGGVIVVEGLLGAPAWAGVVAGGLIGNWWYSQHADQMRAAAVKKANLMIADATARTQDVAAYATDAISGAQAKLMGWTALRAN
ncbi:MAG: hypothetical protein HY246_05130 [Proteobacteria bacterium]|nr:hypothetical protein [Pseudomonadota bacterium]